MRLLAVSLLLTTALSQSSGGGCGGGEGGSSVGSGGGFGGGDGADCYSECEDFQYTTREDCEAFVPLSGNTCVWDDDDESCREYIAEQTCGDGNKANCGYLTISLGCPDVCGMTVTQCNASCEDTSKVVDALNAEQVANADIENVNCMEKYCNGSISMNQLSDSRRRLAEMDCRLECQGDDDEECLRKCGTVEEVIIIVEVDRSAVNDEDVNGQIDATDLDALAARVKQRLAGDGDVQVQSSSGGASPGDVCPVATRSASNDETEDSADSEFIVISDTAAAGKPKSKPAKAPKARSADESSESAEDSKYGGGKAGKPKPAKGKGRGSSEQVDASNEDTEEDTPMVVAPREDTGRAAPSPTPRPKKASGGKAAKGETAEDKGGESAEDGESENKRYVAGAGHESHEDTGGEGGESEHSRYVDGAGQGQGSKASPKPKPASKSRTSRGMQKSAAPPAESSSPDGDLPAVVAVMLGPPPVDQPRRRLMGHATTGYHTDDICPSVDTPVPPPASSPTPAPKPTSFPEAAPSTESGYSSKPKSKPGKAPKQASGPASAESDSSDSAVVSTPKPKPAKGGKSKNPKPAKGDSAEGDSSEGGDSMSGGASTPKPKPAKGGDSSDSKDGGASTPKPKPATGGDSSDSKDGSASTPKPKPATGGDSSDSKDGGASTPKPKPATAGDSSDSEDSGVAPKPRPAPKSQPATSAPSPTAPAVELIGGIFEGDKVYAATNLEYMLAGQLVVIYAGEDGTAAAFDEDVPKAQAKDNRRRLGGTLDGNPEDYSSSTAIRVDFSGYRRVNVLLEDISKTKPEPMYEGKPTPAPKPSKGAPAPKPKPRARLVVQMKTASEVQRSSPTEMRDHILVLQEDAQRVAEEAEVVAAERKQFQEQAEALTAQLETCSINVPGGKLSENKINETVQPTCSDNSGALIAIIVLLILADVALVVYCLRFREGGACHPDGKGKAKDGFHEWEEEGSVSGTLIANREAQATQAQPVTILHGPASAADLLAEEIPPGRTASGGSYTDPYNTGGRHESASSEKKKNASIDDVGKVGVAMVF